MAIGLEMYRRQREEEKRRESLRKQLNKVRKECEVLIRSNEDQRFMRVYILMAFDRIIHELAYRRSLGKAEVELREEKDEQFIDLVVTNKKMTQTDVREILEQNLRDEHTFNLVKALSFVDDFKIETAEDGGVKLSTTKKLNTEVISS
ncbi:MAG: hypothetical protein ACQEP7_00500 [bacterium]